MSAKPETVFRQKCERILTEIPRCWAESIQQKAICGTPDKLCCINGKFVALEFKGSEQSKRSALQEYKLQMIRKAGGEAHFVYPENWDEIYQHLLIL
jgi:hypothetical protein